MAVVAYFADVGEFAAEGVCVFRAVRHVRVGQRPVADARRRAAAAVVYRFQLCVCVGVHFYPFMVLPIFNALEELPPSLVDAARDLGASAWTTFRRVVFPLTLGGVKAGCQAVFIPALSLFMITRLVAGNRVITLGTAIEQHFLVTQDWGMGATIAVVLMAAMAVIVVLTGTGRKEGSR